MTKGDRILILFIILLSFVSFAYINRHAFSQQEKYISVQVNGEEIKKILYDEQLIGHTIPVETEYGYSLIEIGDRRVRLIEADCPDQICVNQGYISRIGETVVCLPNKLVIEVKGEPREDDIDIMNY
ncbi:MAG: NusG domain II-containing protein [Bacillota bacterium]